MMIRADMSHLSDRQVGYIAGLIDGEGSLESQREMGRGRATPQFSLRLSFTMGTPEPLNTVGEWVGAVYKVYPPTDPSRQPRHRMDLRKRIALPLLKRVLPALILKRRQAEIILEIENIRAQNSPSRSLPMGIQRRMPAHAVDAMEKLHIELRSLKSAKRPK